MMRRQIAVFGACGLLLAAAATSQNSAELLPLGPGDLAPASLHAAPPDPSGLALRASREAVSFAWPLDPREPLALGDLPLHAMSKEYWSEVTAAELRQGIDIYTTGSGALVRINPVAVSEASARGLAIEPEQIELEGPSGHPLESGAMDLTARARDLEASGAPFPPGTSAFRLAPELGPGRFGLRAGELQAPDETRYVVHVFDHDSPVELQVRSARGAYLHAERFELSAALIEGTINLEAETMDGFIVSPVGRAFPLDLTRRSDGSFEGSLRLAAREAFAPGLWEVHATATGQHGDSVAVRAVRGAFAVAVPTARLTRVATVHRAAGEEALEVALGVEAASAGRFEARGILYGTDAAGEPRPIAVAHSAEWLEAGDGTLVLRFAEELLTHPEVSAPYEVRDLQLLDQARMGLLHRQERALVLP